MDLVDKWTAEGKINDGNKEQTKHLLDTIWKITYTPQTNQLTCSSGNLSDYSKASLSLEDFHTKALRLSSNRLVMKEMLRVWVLRDNYY